MNGAQVCFRRSLPCDDLVPRADQPQAVEEGQVVPHLPALHNQAIFQPPHHDAVVQDGVIGGGNAKEIARVRALAPNLPLLIPGVGAQGGDAEATVKAAWAGAGSCVINSSRAILYASDGADFAAAARRVAEQTRAQLNAAKPA